MLYNIVAAYYSVPTIVVVCACDRCGSRHMQTGQSNASGGRSECTWVYQTMQAKRDQIDQIQNRDANGSNRTVHAQGGL